MGHKWFWLALPPSVLALIVALLLIWRPLDQLSQKAPPVEEAAIERTYLTPGMISLDVRTDGSEPVVIAQVQVDTAYRLFTATPAATGARLGLTRIDIPYPWIEGEAHHIALLTSTGAIIEHSIEVATATPVLSGTSLWLLAMVGLLLGAVPVATGLLAWPAMRSLSRPTMNFLLALTIGLLVFLLIDTIGEGLEAAAETIGRLRGTVLFWVMLAITTLVLLAMGRAKGAAPEGLRLATFIALGIGLHNLGEGLAVGAALATGAAALATFLVIGFTIHNVTEGIGIAVPLAEERPKLSQFVGLAALAGLPAIAGTILGTQAVSPLWIAVCFGVGAGAILQVVIEVAALLARRSEGAQWLSPPVAAGVCAGLGIMYATALLV
ncbi:MAG: ZIP family metal transporter [Aestuariivirga sp.]